MSATTRHLAAERGSVMIEFAIVMPILLFLILGIVDFGKAINYWNDTNQLAADSARFAAVYGDGVGKPALTFASIRGQAETGELQSGKLLEGSADEYNSPSTAGQTLKVCINALETNTDGTPDRSVGKPIKVTVSTVYNLIPFLGQNTKVGGVTINGEAVMRLEQPYGGPLGCDPA